MFTATSPGRPTLFKRHRMIVVYLMAFVLIATAIAPGIFLSISSLGESTGEEFEVVKTIDAHSSGIIKVAWSPDGEYIATASWDTSIKIWDTSTWTLKKTLTDHTAAVYSIEWSPDGELLASGSWDHSVIIWDTSDWTVDTTLTDTGGNIRSVAWSSDGSYLAAGSDDDYIWIWDTTSWASTSYSCTDVPWSIDWSPDDDYIAAGQYDWKVSIWDRSDDSIEKTLSGFGDNVFSVGYSNGGDLLATGSAANQVHLWTTDTWEEAETLSLDGRVFSLDWSPTDERFVTGDWDKDVTFWTTDGWTSDQTITLTDHVYSVVWSSTSDVIGCGTADGKLTIIKWTPNNAPIAVAGSDQKSIVGETVSFDGTGSSDADGTIVSHNWDFGDGSTHGSGSTVTHSYSEGGTYTVTLTVTDDDGATGSDTLTVVVLTPCQAIDELIAIVEGMNLQNGIDNSLDSKLENAQDALDDLKNNEGQSAANKLNSFINEVEAQAGKKMTQEQADLLVAYCQRVIDIL